MLKQVHIIVYGKVQGIFFRQSVLMEAQRLDLSGWVRNLEDGAVEITAEGEERDLKELAEWCYNGPRGAKVEKTDIEWRDWGNKFDHFKILV